MRILIIGGTRFIGRHLTESAMRAGHQVTLFHRGNSAHGIFPGADHRIGDRDVDLSPLDGGTWEATIDMCAYFPRQVHQLADRLGPRAGRYTLISSVSAYSHKVERHFTEDSPLATLDDPTIETITDGSYGGLKVLCEDAARTRFGEGSLVVRPTYVIGPHDLSWRFPWWVMRLAAGGTVLAPGPAELPAQVIDARDIAAWIVSMIERGAGGTFHTVGPQAPITWGELLDTVATIAAPAGTRLEWIPSDHLKALGMDDTLLPLWPGAEPSVNMLTADPSAAIAAGMKLRPLHTTIADTLAWASTATPGPVAEGRLSREREAQLLADWAQQLSAQPNTTG